VQHHDHHQRRRSLYRFQYDFGTLGGSHSASDYWGEVVNWRSVAKFFVADFIHPDKLLVFIREAYFDVSAVVHMGSISAIETEEGTHRFVAQVTVYARALGVALAQKAYGTGESSERAALKELLAGLDLEGVLIQADALHTTQSFFTGASPRGPTCS